MPRAPATRTLHRLWQRARHIANCEATAYRLCGKAQAQHCTTIQRMKRIFVIATGGTIAGVGEAGARSYRSGELSVAALLESVPGLGALAHIEAHQLANIGSQDMSEALWFALAALVTQKLDSADCDGVVIIHGTDTLEETAFFLHCVLPQSAKPVVLTGAMRPATALSPDGPRNLFAAIAVAADAASAHRGVLVAFADHIFCAAGVAKIHTQNLDAFDGGVCGALGSVRGAEVVYRAPAAAAGEAVPAGRLETLPMASLLATLPPIDLPALAAAGALPQVVIVTAHVGLQAQSIEALVRLGCRGIVVAALGNGNVSAGVLTALQRAQQNGVAVVRATRVPFGGVTACGEVEDAAHGFICAGALNPQKARILLALALAANCTLEETRDWFARCMQPAPQSKFHL